MSRPDKKETLDVTDLKVTLNGLLSIALTKTKHSLGGKEVAERADIASAIRIIELQIKLVELERPPVETLLRLIYDAPSHVVDAWLTVNKYLLLPKAMQHRSKLPPATT